MTFFNNLFSSFKFSSEPEYIITEETKTDAIFVRIENRTGEPFRKVILGDTIKKMDHYKSPVHKYHTIYLGIPDGTFSDYQPTKGKFLGYREVFGFLENGQTFSERHTKVATAIKAANIPLQATTLRHPYTRKRLTEPTLPDGKYTFTIFTEWFSERYCHSYLEITKDA